MAVLIFNLLVLTLISPDEAWQSGTIFIVPNAYTVKKEQCMWEFPGNIHYGFFDWAEVLVSGLLHTGYGSYNMYGSLGSKLTILNQYKGMPISVGVEAEMKTWGSTMGRDYAGLRGCFILSRTLLKSITINAFGNYGWNNFGKSLGPLDFYLDKMKLKIVPIFGLGLRFKLSNEFCLMGESFFSSAEFYRLGEERWTVENLFAYGVGIGISFNLGVNKVALLKAGLSFPPAQDYTEYKQVTKMVEDGEVRSCRYASWWTWNYKYYFGLSVLFQRKQGEAK